MAAQKTWVISDIDGSSRREVTLQEFLAENANKREAALNIFAASRLAIEIEHAAANAAPVSETPRELLRAAS